MLIENDPLEGNGLELEVEFDGAIDDDFEYGLGDEPDYEPEHEDAIEEEEEEDSFFQRDISSKPNQKPVDPTQSDPFGNSQLMRDIMYYRTLGYSDEQILDGMAKLKGQSSKPMQNEQPPDFMTVGEESAWYAKKAVQEQLESLISPLANKINQWEQQQQRASQDNIKSQNGVAFTQTLNNYGLDAQRMDKTEYERLDAAMESMYPGVDFSVTPITPKMAEGIVRLAFGGKQSRGGGQSKQMIQQPPPRIMGGNISSARRTDNTRTFKVDGVPKNERIARMKQFLG